MKFTIFSKSRLRDKLARAFITIGIIPLVLMGFVSIYFLNLTNLNNISSLETQLIRQKIEETEKFLDDIIGLFQLQVGYSQTSEIEHSQQKFLLEQMMKQAPALVEVSFLNLRGLESAKLTRYENPFQELFDQSDSEKFKVAKSGSDYIGPVYYTLSGPMMTIASPVKNKNGQIIQVLTGEVNLASFEKFIKTSQLGNTGYLLVVDKTGNVISGSLKDFSLHQNIKQSGLIARILKGEIRLGLENEDRYKSFFGEKVIGSGEKVRKLGWAFIAEWPQNDAFLVVSTIKNQVLVFSIFAMLALFFVSTFFADKIVGPIKQMGEGAKIIGEGKFEYQLNILTKDELQDLAEEFNKMAQNLKKLKELQDEFVFIAAHELRAPITAIRGYVSMILEGTAGKITTKAKDFLDNVQQASERLAELINDLLEVARSEAKRIKIEVSPQDITEIIKSVINDLKPLAEKSKIKVYYKIEKHIRVLADPDKLKEVLINLLSNAIKYNREHGEVNIYHEVKNGSLITHIQDTGIGMSKEDLEHLFEKFYRSESAKVKVQVGTGLGLFIVKQLLEKMQGSIWAKSVPNEGSIFSFNLPLAS